jgi:hypothetical protein
MIVSLPDESLRVCVASPTPQEGGVWVKKFQSKLMCLTELKTLGLLTDLEVTEACKSNFEKRNAMLRFHAVAEPDALQAAQFVYT